MEAERAADIAKIVAKLEKLKEQVEELRESEQEIYDDMSEKQQESSKGETLQEVIDNLDTAYSDVDDAISVLEGYTAGVSCEGDEEKMEKTKVDIISNQKMESRKSETSASMGFPKNLRRNTEIMTGTFEANLYDENGYLYLSKCGYLSEIKSDRETVLLTCCGCGDVLYKVASGRLYISM